MTERLEAAALTRMATDYLARYAAPSRRLRQVLERRVRRWYARRDLPLPDETGRLVDDVVARLIELGLVDDRSFAIGKARSLVRKGLPERRIRAVLGAAGLEHRSAEVDEVLEHDEAAQARRYAARKRLGPYGQDDRSSLRDKDMRSLLRAGFSARAAAAALEAEPEG